jgi:hypothetical protein
MEIYQDFKELAAVLNAHRVEYLVVGAHALARHGVVRNTLDFDVLVRPTLENGIKIVAALQEFGFVSLGVHPEELMDEDLILQLGYPPVRIDIITSISGVTWNEAYLGRVPGKLGDVDTFFLGREQFIKNKLAAGRKKDLGDIEALGED